MASRRGREDALAVVDAWRDAGETFDFGGRRVFYRREGAGTPLLCIHGYPTSGFDYVKIWPGLTARFDVIAPDMLGFGFTDKPRGHRYGIFEQAALHVALLERLGVREPVHVLCHDYGVTVAQELLARHEEGRGPTLRSVAFLNGGLFPETHRPRPIQRLLASRVGPLVARLSTERAFRRALTDVFGKDTQPTEDELVQLYAITARDDGLRALAGLIRYMSERRAHRARWVTPIVTSRVPMRFINGVHDPVSGAHMLTRLCELRPDADVVRLPVAHYPQLEAPDAVLDAYLAFVARL